MAEVVMLRAAADKAVLIVEGGFDQRMLISLVNEDYCDIVIANYRDRAYQSLLEVRKRGLVGILCLLDRDYAELLGKKEDDPDVVFTDGPDLESMLIRSPAFYRILNEMGSKYKLAKLKSTGRSPLTIMHDAVYELGVLRFLSQRDRLELTFDGLRYGFIDRRSMATNTEQMLREVHNNSRRQFVDGSQLLRAIAEWKQTEHDTWEMCCGHDLAAALGKALQSVLGNNNAQSVRQEEVESRLRLAYSEQHFKSSELYKQIRAWEERNKPYTCCQD